MKILKKIIYFIIILFCFMIFTSCRDREIKNISTEIEFGDENGGGTGILANNNAVDFYFYYPENCFIQRDDTMIIIYANDEEVLETGIGEPVMVKSNLSATVFGLQTGTYETVEEFWEDFVFPSYQEIYQTIEVLSEEDLIIDKDTNNIRAKKYTYTCSLSTMKYKYSEVIFFRKQKVYILLYTSTENKYQDNINILNTAVDTFRFK